MLTESNKQFIPVEIYKTKLLKRRRLEGDCWIWTGAESKTNHGTSYGKIWVREIDSLLSVHRLALLLYRPGEFKTDLQVNHLCNTMLCFNPEHLYAGTAKENSRDWIEMKGHHNSRTTHCPYGHPYIASNTYIAKNGQRVCKECTHDRYIRKKNQTNRA